MPTKSGRILSSMILVVALGSALCLTYPNNVLANPEEELLQALDAIQSSEIDKAERLLKTLLTEEPEFKLAYMVYADVLKTRVSPLSHAGMGMTNSEKRDALINEVRVRYGANQDFINAGDKIPAALSKLNDQNKHAIVVDLKQSRLYLFENTNGQPKYVADYYISMGRGGGEKKKEGDLKTPLGVYHIKSFIPPDKLTDKYGAGAYPINYPNELDISNGLTGSGIWLHGTRSGTYNRAPLASEGCVVLPNDDLIELGSYIEPGQTPVLIGNDIEWLNARQWQQNNLQITAVFNQWITNWTSLDVESYLDNYSKDFNNGKKNYSRWAKHKRHIAKNKRYIDVTASNLSLLKHPNEDILVATFQQNYKSNNYADQSWKRQYWKKESDGKWRIIYEREIKPPSPIQLAKKQ